MTFWGDFSVGTPGRIDADVRALLDHVAATGVPPVHALDVATARSEYRRAVVDASLPPPPGVGAEDMTIAGGVRLRVYRPDTATAGAPVLVYFHGGGFVIGDVETYDPMCRFVAAVAATVVVAVGYRLAPEHPHPAAVEDGWRALRWVAERWAPRRLGVAGDSAGGNLAAVMALKARDADLPLALQVLIYPVTDLVGDFPSRRLFADGYLLGGRDIDWFLEHHTGGRRLTAADASPLRAASHAGLAPAVVLTAGFDPLRDEGRAYAAALAAAGVPVRHVCFEGTIHGCVGLSRLVQSGRAVLEEAAMAWAHGG